MTDRIVLKLVRSDSQTVKMSYKIVTKQRFYSLNYFLIILWISHFWDSGLKVETFCLSSMASVWTLSVISQYSYLLLSDIEMISWLAGLQGVMGGGPVSEGAAHAQPRVALQPHDKSTACRDFPFHWTISFSDWPVLTWLNHTKTITDFSTTKNNL